MISFFCLLIFFWICVGVSTKDGVLNGYYNSTNRDKAATEGRVTYTDDRGNDRLVGSDYIVYMRHISPNDCKMFGPDIAFVDSKGTLYYNISAMKRKGILDSRNHIKDMNKYSVEARREYERARRKGEV